MLQIKHTDTVIRKGCYAAGITMLEVVITTILVLIFAGLILPWQVSSWKRTSGYTRTTTACQIIEKQIEQRRILISMNPDLNYTKFRNLADTTLWDSTSKPPIKFYWKIAAAKDRNGVALVNVRKVIITATLGVKDSLVVTTSIAKNF
jgi:type II secretory pathway pseudopilin PulG